MPFDTIPVNIAGPSYQSRSRPLSSQSTINFYHEFDEGGKSPLVLHSWPGEKLIGAGAAGIGRGSHIMAGVEYRVVGSTLFEVSSAGAHTSRGTVKGSDMCIFANDGSNMFIVNAGFVQQYSNQSNSIVDVTDPDIAGSIAVAYLNSQFIYTKTNQFIISDVGDGSSASALNTAQAESQPDDLVRAYVFDQIVYMFGVLTTEPWWNSGSGLPPFDRIDTQMMSIGLSAIHSVANNDSFIYWLGDDRQVYQASGGSFNRVSSIAIAHAIEGYAVVSDAVGFTMTMEGQNFYMITFPTEGKTWMINEGLGKNGWFQLSADSLGGKYNINSHAFINGKHHFADDTNGNLYELDLNTYTNNGASIHRTRVMSSIHGGLLNAPGKSVQMSRFELIMETGVGLITGQGEDPIIMIESSIDGGKSFQSADFVNIGRLGDTSIRVEWWSLITFTDLIIRMTTSDPVHYTIFSGAIDLRLAGR